MSRAQATYPSVDAYLATLPDGWASHPECEVRSAILGSLRERGTFDGLRALPAELARNVATTPDGSWLPEIVGVGALLAVRDARFGGPSGELEFLAWMDSLNAGLLQSSLPASIATPVAAIAWMTDGWAMFHRGTSLSVVECNAHDAEIAFAHPRNIFPGAWMEVRRRTVVAVLARTGAAQPSVRATRADDGSTRFHATWR